MSWHCNYRAKSLCGLDWPRGPCLASRSEALVNGLVSQVGWPLTEEKLGRLTVTHLRNALSQGGSIDADDADAPVADVVENYGVALLKKVIEILWGQKREEEALPPVEPYSAGTSLTRFVSLLRRTATRT